MAHQTPLTELMRRAMTWQGVIAVVVALAAISAHGYLVAGSFEIATPFMILDRVFDVGIVAIASLAWIGLGRILLRALRYTSKSFVGDTVLAWGLGAGGISHVLLALGMLHILYVPVIWAIFVGTLILTAKAWRDWLMELSNVRHSQNSLSRLERMLVLGIGLLVLPIFLGALTPPLEGDALSYQLAAPAQFIARNAVVPLYQNAGGNYPLGAGMLFVFGLAFNSPIAAQLIHFAYGLALMGAVYTLAAENLSRTVAFLAIAILWTSPVVGLEASAPLVDLGWVFYEFVAVWMIWGWHRTRANPTLILAGLSVGLAVSSKYLAFVGWGTLSLFVVVDAWIGSQRNFGATVQAFVLFNVVALLGGFPWLAKNFLLLGNPVYPFFWGAYGLDGQLQKSGGSAVGLSDWVGAGMGNDLKALLAFPYNVYVHWDRFDPVKNRGGPSLFFWFLPLYPFVKKVSLINALLVLVVIRFAVWWNLTQFVRYGLILFPLLSVICAYVVWELYQRLRGRWVRPLLQVGLALFLVVGITLQWGFFFMLREGSLAFLLGMQSQAAFLDSNLRDARVTRFMNGNLAPDAKVFALGDTRVFYLERDVIGDVSHTNWADISKLGKTALGVREQLRTMGVTHIWVSEDEIVYAKNFWLIPAPWEDSTLSFVKFREEYLKLLYQDERGHTVYQLER